MNDEIKIILYTIALILFISSMVILIQLYPITLLIFFCVVISILLYLSVKGFFYMNKSLNETDKLLDMQLKIMTEYKNFKPNILKKK